MFGKCIETIIYSGDHPDEKKHTTASKNAADQSKGYQAALNSITHVEIPTNLEKSKADAARRARSLL